MNEFILFYFKNIYYIIYIHIFPPKKKYTHIYIEFFFTKAWIIRCWKKKLLTNNIYFAFQFVSSRCIGQMVKLFNQECVCLGLNPWGDIFYF